MSDSPQLALWKKYLRADPTRWLLETDDPSILLWYQIDIAHRPEDAVGVISTRERVLYSEPVQTIFAAQNEIGYWGDAENLAQPYYSATLWNLALLAELGIPRHSRRARNACEFVLQKFLRDDGTFAGLNEIESGYLIHALAYFNLSQDERVIRAARRLREDADSFEARVCALWAWCALRADEKIARAAQAALERVLDDAARNAAARNAAASVPYAFPQFDARDELFLLHVLAEYERASDARVAPFIEPLVAKQNERAQWTLERDWNAQLLTPFEKQNAPSRWITLNALRVITNLVMGQT